MNNCLVTQLSSSVDNDKLEKLGELNISIIGTPTYVPVCEGYAVNPTGQVSGTTIRDFDTTIGRFEVFPGDGSLCVTNKYTLEKLILFVGFEGCVKLNQTTGFSFLPNLQELQLAVTGDINTLKLDKSTALTKLRLQDKTAATRCQDVSNILPKNESMTELDLRNFIVSTDVLSNYKNLNTLNLNMCSLLNANIDDLCGLTKLTYLEISYAVNLNGTIEGFAQAMHKKGRKSGVLTIKDSIYNTHNVSYYGEFHDEYTLTFNEEGCVITAK